MTLFSTLNTAKPVHTTQQNIKFSPYRNVGFSVPGGTWRHEPDLAETQPATVRIPPSPPKCVDEKDTQQTRHTTVWCFCVNTGFPATNKRKRLKVSESLSVSPKSRFRGCKKPFFATEQTRTLHHSKDHQYGPPTVTPDCHRAFFVSQPGCQKIAPKVCWC